jgi:hypothetical protein
MMPGEGTSVLCAPFVLRRAALRPVLSRFVLCKLLMLLGALPLQGERRRFDPVSAHHPSRCQAIRGDLHVIRGARHNPVAVDAAGQHLPGILTELLLDQGVQLGVHRLDNHRRACHGPSPGCCPQDRARDRRVPHRLVRMESRPTPGGCAVSVRSSGRNDSSRRTGRGSPPRLVRSGRSVPVFSASLSPAFPPGVAGRRRPFPGTRRRCRRTCFSNTAPSRTWRLHLSGEGRMRNGSPQRGRAGTGAWHVQGTDHQSVSRLRRRAQGFSTML